MILELPAGSDYPISTALFEASIALWLALHFIFHQNEQIFVKVELPSVLSAGTFSGFDLLIRIAGSEMGRHIQVRYSEANDHGGRLVDKMTLQRLYCRFSAAPS